MKETNIQNEIRIEVSRHGGAIALRNNTGLFKTFDGRKVRAGLGTGTSDLIGIASHVVTPEDVGRVVGLFLALECKTDLGMPTDEQGNFLTLVAEMGGLAAVVRSPAEAISVVSEKWSSNLFWKPTKRNSRRP